MIIIINNLISFFNIGAYLQAILQGAVLNNSNIFNLCINIFIFLFYSFAIIIVFPAYKEMKAIFLVSAAAAQSGNARNNDLEANLRPNGNNNQNQGQARNVQPSQVNNNNNFVPFGGRGVSVG